MTTHALFGEGLQWGGMAIVYLLGQSQRFTALNFTTAVLKINAAEPKDKEKEDVGNVKMADFVALAKHYDAVIERYVGRFFYFSQ